jgi:ParB-like chromosome segregation protein Spo0J
MTNNPVRHRALIEETRMAFFKRLRCKGWQHLEELSKRISANDASCRMVLAGQSGTGKSAIQLGRALLAQEVIDQMLADGVCEVCDDGDGRMVRRAQADVPVVTEVGATVGGVAAESETAITPASPIAPAEAVAAPAGSAAEGSADTPVPAPPLAAPPVGAEAGTGDLPVHDLANLFPPLQGADFEALKSDIRKYGQRERIWLHGGMIIDGRSRYRACKELGKEPATRVWDGNGSLLAFVLGLNLHRRHLNPSQRAVVAAKVKPLFEEEAQARMRAGKPLDPMANLPQGRGPARDQAAAEVNVSPRSVDAASKVLRKGCAELVEAVEAGKVSVSAAARLADLTKPKQAKVLNKGGKQVKAKAGQMRKQRGRTRLARGAHAAAGGKGGGAVDQQTEATVSLTLALPVTPQALVAALRPHVRREDLERLLREGAELLSSPGE